jgi:uncharacterized protein (TIGR01244 family)
MKHFAIAIITMTTAGALAAAAELPQQSDVVPNYVLIAPGVAGGGQPALEDLARIKDMGFRTVINLRTEGERGYLAGEGAALQEAGVRYVHVPLTASTFSAADVAAIRALLDDPAARPVLVHCTSGNRVGMVWGAVAASRGKSVEDAEAEGRRAGMHGDATTEALRRVAAPKK